MPSTPISPEKLKQELKPIPDVVFDVVNQMLREKKDPNSKTQFIKIKQDEVVAALVSVGVDRSKIFEHKMLDFEGHYRKAGWKVVYDKPAYYESYSAFWEFSE